MIRELAITLWFLILCWWIYLFREEWIRSSAFLRLQDLTRQIAYAIVGLFHELEGKIVQGRNPIDDLKAQMEATAKNDLVMRQEIERHLREAQGIQLREERKIVNTPSYQFATFEGVSPVGQLTTYNNLTQEQVMNSKTLYQVTIIDREVAATAPLAAAKQFLVVANSPEAARTIVLIDQGYTVEGLEKLHIDSREVTKVPLLPAAPKATEAK